MLSWLPVGHGGRFYCGRRSHGGSTMHGGKVAAAIGAMAIFLAGCSAPSSNTAATVTSSVTITATQTITETVTYTPPPPTGTGTTATETVVSDTAAAPSASAELAWSQADTTEAIPESRSWPVTFGVAATAVLLAAMISTSVWVLHHSDSRARSAPATHTSGTVPAPKPAPATPAPAPPAPPPVTATVPAPAPSVSVPVPLSEQDLRYLNLLAGDGIWVRPEDRAQALNAAHLICSDLRQGMPRDQVYSRAMRGASTYIQAVEIVDLACQAYCPDQLPPDY
jgi:Protein of unknown function (DUF732)